MNKIINKFLLTGDKSMPEFHLKQPGFNLKHLYRNELEKACFAHDATYCDSKDLAKRTSSDKILKDRAYEIAISRKYDGYQRASMVYQFFDEKAGLGVSVNEQLAE